MDETHWKIADLPWDRFNPAALEPDLLKVVKAASLVEYGGNKYAQYLCNIFPDDNKFQMALRDWAIEEVQHGEALGRYAELADLQFEFQKSYERFTVGYGFDIDAAQSVRGSRAGELIARCIVETGTSSYYTALADATQEPLLQVICRNIAADEFRHYKLFYTYLKKYLDQEELGKFQRLKIGLGRINESEDDELCYAYYAANAPVDAVYDHEAYKCAYMARAYRFYKPQHVDRVVAMVFKACGLKPHSVWHDMASRMAWVVMSQKARYAIGKAA